MTNEKTINAIESLLEKAKDNYTHEIDKLSPKALYLEGYISGFERSIALIKLCEGY